VPVPPPRAAVRSMSTISRSWKTAFTRSKKSEKLAPLSADRETMECELPLAPPSLRISVEKNSPAALPGLAHGSNG
jgi:hypothetical protein